MEIRVLPSFLLVLFLISTMVVTVSVFDSDFRMVLIEEICENPSSEEEAEEVSLSCCFRTYLFENLTKYYSLSENTIPFEIATLYEFSYINNLYSPPEGRCYFSLSRYA